MTATPDSTLADPQQVIADLRRANDELHRTLDERTHERDEALHERDEALQRETAVAEVLQVINSSPGDLTPVFDTMLEKAVHLCGAAFGALFLSEGEHVRAVAMRGGTESWRDRMRTVGFRISETPVSARLLTGEPFVHIADLAQLDHPLVQAAVSAVGARTLLSVPLRKDHELRGMIIASRAEVRPYSDKEIALLQNFAAQAVIAMENARLITETREALEQQTATAEVLQVINSSPGDLAPVFDAMLEKAHKLCGVTIGVLGTYDGECFRVVGARGLPEPLAMALREPFHPFPNSAHARLLSEPGVIHIPDMATETLWERDDPIRTGSLKAGVRTLLFVPLRKEGVLLGYISANRLEVRPYSDKEIALLQNFAAQAVIAMENARLITETREALEQQTATSEVLQVINSSPGDLTPVFDAMLEKATRLCNAPFGQLAIYDGELFRFVAAHGETAFALNLQREPHPASDGVTWLRILGGEDVVHVPDVRDTDLYRGGHLRTREFVDNGRGRSLLSVALRKDEALLGILSIYRQEPQPFTDKQIALLENFAAQAVIAMENARLITETREALEQQTATAEVLQVINRSPGDLAPVFDAMLEKAMRLCDAAFGHMFTYDGDHFRTVASHGSPAKLTGLLTNELSRPTPNSPPRRIIDGENIVSVEDLRAFPSYQLGESRAVALVELGGVRSYIIVALRKDRQLLGMIAVYRQEVRPFTDKQIALLQNFAAQAVIAMENARLLGELRASNDEIAGWNRELEARVAAQLAELERTGRLRRFLAPQLADLIIARGDESILESHRREIVVVFCDIRGFTGFAERVEPEEVMALLRDYHAALGPIVARFEGTLDHYSGDGVMVFFNDPLPTPEPAKRAIEMAVALREAAHQVLKVWRRHGHDLGFGVGISQGYATLGQIGFAERMDYTAIGTVCNLAARLCDEAKDGQILISRRVAVSVEEDAKLEEIGEVPLKGLSQAVAVYNVVQ